MNLIFAMMFSVLPMDVRLSMLDGSVRSGAIRSVDETKVVLADAAGDGQVSLSDVMLLEFSDLPVEETEAAQRLLLRDGTELSGVGAGRNAREVLFTQPMLGEIRVPVDAVQSLRIKAADAVLDSQWDTMRSRQTEKDLLVVTKRDGSGLDFLAGVVSSVQSDKVEFLLDGETVPVPIARVYGVVFGQGVQGSGKTAASKVRVTLRSGDVLTGDRWTMSGERFELRTSWGASISGDVAGLQRVDLSAGRLTWLSDLPVLREDFTGVDPEGSLLAGLASPEEQLLLFGPRRDVAIQGRTKLKLRGKEYSKGLCIHSRTEVAWALDQKYESLEMQVGIDDEVAWQDGGQHSVRLIVRGDDGVLLERMIAGKDEPMSVSLPLTGVSTLTVVVDFGDEDSICDWLDLADARLRIRQGAAE